MKKGKIGHITICTGPFKSKFKNKSSKKKKWGEFHGWEAVGMEYKLLDDTAAKCLNK